MPSGIGVPAAGKLPPAQKIAGPPHGVPPPTLKVPTPSEIGGPAAKAPAAGKKQTTEKVELPRILVNETIYSSTTAQVVAPTDPNWENDPSFVGLRFFTHEATLDGFLEQIKSGAALAGRLVREMSETKSNKTMDDRGGGGDYVYVRPVTSSYKAVVGKGSIGSNVDTYPIMLIFDRKLVRRCDFWASGTDLSGKLPPKLDAATHGQNRDSVRKLLMEAAENSGMQPECGFHLAIPFKDLLRIVIKGRDDAHARLVLKKLLMNIIAHGLDQRLHAASGKPAGELFSWVAAGEKIRTIKYKSDDSRRDECSTIYEECRGLSKKS